MIITKQSSFNSVDTIDPMVSKKYQVPTIIVTYNLKFMFLEPNSYIIQK